MKHKIKLLVMLLFVAVLSIQAQPQRRTVEERTKMIVDRVNDSLKISDAQKADLTNAFSDYYKAQDKLMEGMAPGTRPEQADRDKLMNDRDAKLKVILKDDQFAKFKAMEANMRGRRGGGGNGGGGGQRPPAQQ